MYFVRKPHVLSSLHAHFDICHYLMISCHFDQMNDKIMFFFILNQYSCHCHASRLVVLDYIRFIHPLGVLIDGYVSLLWKHLSYDFH